MTTEEETIEIPAHWIVAGEQGETLYTREAVKCAYERGEGKIIEKVYELLLKYQTEQVTPELWREFKEMIKKDGK